MEQSILKTVKKAVGVADDDPSFDLDIIMHINSEFSNLNGLGVGPVEGFVIEDDTAVWADYLNPVDDKVKLSHVKTAIILRTRLLFDPPTIGFLLDAMKEQLKEQEWRLNVNRENEEWTDPTPPSQDALDDVVIIDGGDAGG